MKKSKKLIGIGKLKLKELELEKREKAVTREKAKEEKKEKPEEPTGKQEAKETRLETETLEAMTEIRAVPASRETSQENTFQEVEFFEPEISTKEFAAPVLTPTEETKEALEVTAQNTPTPRTNISTTDNINYTAQENISYSSYSPNSNYEASSRSYETQEGRRRGEERERFDIREGLIVDSSKIVPTLNAQLANQFISGRDRAMPQRAELEEFAEDQRKYKEKIEEDRKRRKILR